MSTDLVFYQDLLSDIKNRIRFLQFNLSILPLPVAKLETVIRKPSVSQLKDTAIGKQVVPQLSKEPISPQVVAKLKETANGQPPVAQFEKASILPQPVAKLENDTISPTPLAKIEYSSILQLAVAKLIDINFFYSDYNNQLI
jgi:hypothetical protein